MKALVTGGAGVVGRALCRELLDRGVDVRVLTLPGDALAKSLPPEVEVFYGDVTDAGSVGPALEDVDTLILGGMDRGLNYHPLVDFLRNSAVRNIILLPNTTTVFQKLR